MLRLSVLVLCALVAAAHAYNFDDSDFNSFLLDELEDIPWTRSKRESDCHHEHHHREKHVHFDCCKGDTFDPKKWESIKDMKRECMKEIVGEVTAEEMAFDPFDCKQMDKVKTDIICVSECIARKADFMDDKGVLVKAAILASIKSKSEGTQWKVDAAGKIVDKCFVQIEGIEKEGKCSMAPMKLTHCIWGQFIQSCPAELQSDSKKCKKMRERMAADDDKQILKRAFFHHLHDLKKTGSKKEE